jgi:hypothetical protein
VLVVLGGDVDADEQPGAFDVLVGQREIGRLVELGRRHVPSRILHGGSRATTPQLPLPSATHHLVE